MSKDPPSRIVLHPLPRLLVYDHCPFSMRVRHCLGIKNIKHELVWLMNDDVSTPTALVGKKVVPIFQPEGPLGPSLVESLDIVKFIDSDSRFGETNMIRPSSGRTDISLWMNETDDAFSRLTKVRFSRTTVPEFTFSDSRNYYIANHPFKTEPFSFNENFELSHKYIDILQSQLEELASMIFCKEYCTEGGISIDDVELFPKLRQLTIVKSLQLPQKIREYVVYHANVSEMPLYEQIAF